jgi:hypothetical protein
MHERFFPLYELSSFWPTAPGEHVRPGAAAPSGYPSSSAAKAGFVNKVANNDVTARTVNTERKVIFITN